MKSILILQQNTAYHVTWSEANEMKHGICNLLLALSVPERKAFISSFEAGIRNLGLSLRSYLIPLGITATRPTDMTPSEVGHLIRFFCVNIPQTREAIRQILSHLEGPSCKASRLKEFAVAQSSKDRLLGRMRRDQVSRPACRRGNGDGRRPASYWAGGSSPHQPK